MTKGIFTFAICLMIFIFTLFNAFNNINTWTMTGKIIMVKHIDSNYYGGSTMLYFSNNNSQRYDIGTYDWILNTNYIITFKVNVFGSISIENVIKIIS